MKKIILSLVVFVLLMAVNVTQVKSWHKSFSKLESNAQKKSIGNHRSEKTKLFAQQQILKSNINKQSEKQFNSARLKSGKDRPMLSNKSQS